MTDEQVKKDTLWEIHTTDQKIACLERRATIILDAMKKLIELWDAERLTAKDGHFVEIREAGSTRLDLRPNAGDLPAILEELAVKRRHRATLQSSFDRM